MLCAGTAVARGGGVTDGGTDAAADVLLADAGVSSSIAGGGAGGDAGGSTTGVFSGAVATAGGMIGSGTGLERETSHGATPIPTSTTAVSPARIHGVTARRREVTVDDTPGGEEGVKDVPAGPPRSTMPGSSTPARLLIVCGAGGKLRSEGGP